MRDNLGRRVILSVLCVFLCVFCKPCEIKASASADSKTIRVGYFENEVFEEGASEDSVKSGYAYEYYRKLSEYTGWKYEYVYGDYFDIYDMLLKGDVDLVAGIAYKDDRKDKILYPDNPMGFVTYCLIKHTGDSSISSITASVNGKKIGVLDSAIKDYLDNYISEHKIRANIVVYSDFDALFKAFDDNVVDLIAVESDGTSNRSNAEVVTSFGSTAYYMCVNREKGWLLRELNNAQTQISIEEPDFMSILRNKYYSVSISSRAFTQAEKNWIENNSEIKIGYLNNYLPYSDTDKKGNAVGLVVDAVPEMFRNLGITSVGYTYYSYDNYDEMTKALEREEIDVAFPVGGGLYYSEEDNLYMSKAVTSSTVNLIYSDNYISASNADFAVNSNNRMQYYYVKTHYPDSSITFYNSTKECLNAVLSGKVKCTTLNGLRTNSMLKNRAYRNLSFRQLSYYDDRSFGVKIGNEGLLRILNRGITNLGQEYFVNIAYKYSENLYDYTIIDLIIDHLWALFVVAIIILAIFLFFVLREKKKAIKEVKNKEKARIEMEKANISKTVFLNRLSEDMHNSVDSIIEYANIAGKENEKRTSEYLSRIKNLGSHLLWLIDDVHEFSSVESGNYSFNEQNIQFRQFIQDIKESTKETIDETISKYNFSGKRILIVDNLDPVRNHAARIMKKAGFEVQLANDGNEAVNKIIAAPAGYFDIVIINLSSPNNEGYEATRQIRNLGNHDKASIPIVAVSSSEFSNLKEVTNE